MFYKNTTIQYCVSSKNYADCNKCLKCLKLHKMFSNSSIRNRNIALFLVIAVCSPICQYLEIYCIVCSLHLEDNFPLDIQESRQDCLVVHSSIFLAVRKGKQHWSREAPVQSKHFANNTTERIVFWRPDLNSEHISYIVLLYLGFRAARLFSEEWG